MTSCSTGADNNFTKDPDSNLDFKASWATWLIDGDTISTSTWIVPDGLTKGDESNTDTTATVWLTGGTLGSTYEVVNRITTVQGRTEDQTLNIDITQH